VVDPLRIANWDDLLRTHPEATIFHSSAWARVLVETYHYTPKYIVAADQHRLWALLPLLEVRSWLTGTRGVSLPFTDRCTPLACPAVDLTQLFEAGRELGRQCRWKSLELRGVPERFAQPSNSFHQHDLDLSGSESELFERCDPAMRRAIRKAQSANIEIETNATIDGIDTYYRLHQLTRKRHGVPPQSLSFFRSLSSAVIEKGYGSLLLARVNKRPVAGAIFLHFGKHSIYKFGASDPSYQVLRPNNLLMWSGILRMKALGAARVSFGRSSLSQEGLARFKRSFGAAESALYYAKYLFNGSTFASSRPDRSGGVHTSLFRFCPIPVARLIGTALYPHVG